jgi:sec-independent protein translocase protein TatB
MTSLQKDVSEALRVDDIDKPAETPAIEPPAAPTTLELPTPETFVEASTHESTEPLAITREGQAETAPQDNAPAATDALKDAKAS